MLHFINIPINGKIMLTIIKCIVSYDQVPKLFQSLNLTFDLVI